MRPRILGDMVSRAVQSGREHPRDLRARRELLMKLANLRLKLRARIGRVSKPPAKQPRPPRHNIAIRAVRKDPPDLDRFTAALLALALERVEEQKRLTQRERN